MNNDNLIKHPGNGIREEIVGLNANIGLLHQQIKLLNEKISVLEQLNEHNAMVIYEFAKSHNGSLDVTQRVFKALARSIDNLQLRIKDMESKKSV